MMFTHLDLCLSNVLKGVLLSLDIPEQSLSRNIKHTELRGEGQYGGGGPESEASWSVLC